MRTKKGTSKEKPIYILGTNAVGLYLAEKLQNGGERVILLADSKEYATLGNTDFSLKEDFGSKKNGFRFETSFWTQEIPKMVIITSNPQNINSDVFHLGKEKLSHCPTLCTTLCEDTSFLERSLNTNIIQVWFDGWVNLKNNHVCAYGKAPELLLYNAKDKEIKKELSKQLAPSTLKLQESTTSEYKEKLYVYMCCSLACAICGKNLTQIFKNKKETDILEQFFQEIKSVSQLEQVATTAEKLLEAAKTTPANYTFPLTESLAQNRSGEYSFFSDYILRYTRRNDCNVENINKALKKIYHTYLSIT